MLCTRMFRFVPHILYTCCKNAPFMNLKLIFHRIVVEKIKKKKIEKSADVVT